MKCPTCEAVIPDEAKFCPGCGYALEKRISPGKLEEVRVKVWLDRIRSNRRWGLFALISGAVILMLGFHVADIMMFILLSITWKQPSIHWELVLGGILLSATGIYLLVYAGRLEEEIEKGEIPSVWARGLR